ncbi:MAG: translation initiation factor IF-2 [Candidatus Pacebacteria bacterium]|nr:translation initiation factor IF-2 [Candidatus Paceibacterota bacterium]
MKPEKNNTIVRPPVIAIMGHIDHGKSTLLDYIRKSNIVDKEAGGITQHVGAYEVVHKAKDGKESKITFLDTPGHAAFTGIRSRGVRVADIAVLVVSAEDGVKAQTIEALKTIQAEEIPYIIAITKIDKPNANIELAKQSMATNEIYVEGYGGSIPCVPISAKTGEGVPELLDMMLLVAEMEELKTDITKPAEGVILESNLDPKKGISATLILTDGTLKSGSYVVSGQSSAPVRIMENFAGVKIAEASAPSPVKIIGWSEMPQIGELFKTVESKKEAEQIALEFKEKMDSIPEKKEELNDKLEIPLVVKADVSGSLEAIQGEIAKIPQEKVKLKIIQSGIGTISESDVKVANGSAGSILIGFSVKIDSQAESLRERLGVQMQMFDIIYKLVEYLEETVKTRTPKVMTEEATGRAKIMKTFSRNKDRQIVGGKVETGEIRTGKEVKILRRDVEIGRGRIKELQQQKAKATEIREGYEFGADIEAKIEIAPGDRVECFDVVEK